MIILIYVVENELGEKKAKQEESHQLSPQPRPRLHATTTPTSAKSRISKYISPILSSWILTSRVLNKIAH